MEDLKNVVQQEAEKQLKEAQQKAEEQQAAAKKMMEEQTQNVGKAVVKGMALSAVMLVGRKIISSLLGKPGKVGLIAVAIVLLSEAAILGTWKHEYHMQEDYNDGALDLTSVGKMTDKGVTTWKFEANGVATCSNTVDIAGGGSPESGWWVIKNGKFEYGTGTKPVDSDLDPYDACVTDKSIMLSKTTVWPTVTCKDYDFFSKVQ